MNSETWFPDRLISDRCVNSRFNILLNCKRERAGEGRKKNVVSFHWGKPGRNYGTGFHGKHSSIQFYSSSSTIFLISVQWGDTHLNTPPFTLKFIRAWIIICITSLLLISLNSPSATNLQFYCTESHFWGLFSCFTCVNVKEFNDVKRKICTLLRTFVFVPTF